MKRFYIYTLAAIGVAAFMLSGCGKKKNNYQKGLDYYRDSNYSQAADCFSKAVASDNDNADKLAYLGLSQLQLGRYNEAIDSFEQAIAYDDGCKNAYKGKGIALFRLGNYAGAKEQFDKVITMCDGRFNDITNDAYVYEAAILYKLGSYQESIDLCTDIINNADDVDLAKLYFYRGSAYAMIQDEGNAALDYEESLKEDDDNYSTYCNMYDCLKQAGYKERGESFLRRLLNDDDVDNMTFGKVYYSLGEYDKAEGYLEKEYKAGNQRAINLLALTYEKEGRYADANSVYEKYIDSHPKDANMLNQYGVYLISREQYANAKAVIEDGIAVGDSDVMHSLKYNQAICYEFLGYYDTAIDLFADIVNEYPTDADANKEYNYLLGRK